MPRLDAFRRELDVFIEDATSADTRREIFVSISREALGEFETAWRARQPGVAFNRFVDGDQARRLEDVVIPGGTVAERVQTVAPMVRRALQLFDIMTKVVTGGYKSETHVFSNDGRFSTVADLANRDDFVIIANVSDFARKAEQRGFNLAAGVEGTGGLFETIASILSREFRDAANGVFFTYRTIEGNRVPVIAIGGAATFAGNRRAGERDNDKGKRRRDREAKRRARRRR